MTDPRVNKYRSAKNPHQQVLVSQNTDDTVTVHVIDTKHLRIRSAKLGEPKEKKG